MAWLLRKGTQDLPLLESRLVHYRDNRSRVENVVERGERGGGVLGGWMGADTCCFVCDISMTSPAVKPVNWKSIINGSFFVEF